MKKSAVLLLLFSLFTVPHVHPVFAEAPGTNAVINYLAEGNRLRGEGDCSGAIENYKKAMDSRQFRELGTFHLSVADCYTALKNYDLAIESYARGINTSRNQALQAELYRGKGRAYYLKAVNVPDANLIGLARANLRTAKSLGADVAGIEKDISRLEEDQKHSPSGNVEAGEKSSITEEDNKPALKTEQPAPRQEIKQEPAKVEKKPSPDNKTRIKKALVKKLRKKTQKKSADQNIKKKIIIEQAGKNRPAPGKEKDITPDELQKLLQESVRK